MLNDLLTAGGPPEMLDDDDDFDAELRKAMRDLVVIMPTLKEMAELWRSASWFAKAVKYIGGMVVGVYAAYLTIKVGIASTFGGKP